MSLLIFLIIGIFTPMINFFVKKKLNKYIYNYKYIFVSWIINAITIYLFFNKYQLDEINRGTISIMVLFLTLNILLDSSIIDIKYQELPNINNAIVFILGIVYLILINPENLWLYIISSVSLFVISFIIACVSTLGGGDIKLLTAIGLYVPVNIGMNVLFYSCIIALIGIFIKKIYLFINKNKKSDIEKNEIENDKLFPFGQYIVLSFFIILFIF